MNVIPELSAILLNPNTANATGLFAGAVESIQDIIITGNDAYLWYPTAIRSEKMVFAIWVDPEYPLVIYAGKDIEQLDSHLRDGVLIIVTGSELGLDVPYVKQHRTPTPVSVNKFFGLENIIVSREDPISAAIRRIGQPETSPNLLSMLGSTITIRAGKNTPITKNLTEHIRTSLTLKNIERNGPTTISKIPWTRSLGSFQIIQSEQLTIPESIGPFAVIQGEPETKETIEKLLKDKNAYFDIVNAADAGHVTSIVTDLTTAFKDKGPVVLTGNAVPPRNVIVLRGKIADQNRSEIESEITYKVWPEKTIIAHPSNSETREQYLAHQWASAQYRAEHGKSSDYNHGGPTLKTEAKSIGLIKFNEEKELEEKNLVTLSTLTEIAYAREWHLIDPEIPPILDQILIETRNQISGTDTPITSKYLQKLQKWNNEPGFWSRLHTAIQEKPGTIVFPYSPDAIDLLRAVIAANGDAVELRQIIGPIKVAVLKSFTPKQPSGGEKIE